MDRNPVSLFRRVRTFLAKVLVNTSAAIGGDPGDSYPFQMAKWFPKPLRRRLVKGRLCSHPAGRHAKTLGGHSTQGLEEQR